jgi:hypothetical protein
MIEPSPIDVHTKFGVLSAEEKAGRMMFDELRRTPHTLRLPLSPRGEDQRGAVPPSRPEEGAGGEEPHPRRIPPTISHERPSE